jgi:seryl-tRNA synthetase
MGFTSALTYDFEVFSTAQDRWLEISSVSFKNFSSESFEIAFQRQRR